MEFLGPSFLGHSRTTRDCFALPPGLARNPPHPAVDFPPMACVVLSRRSAVVVGRRCLASGYIGRPVPGRPYDTAPDTNVGSPSAAAAGRACRPLLRALPRSVLRDGLGPFFRTPILHRLVRLLTHPVLAWVAMNIAYLGWHVPRAYELALRSPGWHEVEHACFLGTSLLFWFPVIQPWPSPSRASRWVLLPYLVGADLVNTALAGLLTFSPRVIYPSYSSLRDQAAAGALMWVVGSIFYLVPVAVIASHLLSPPSRRRSSLANSQPAHISTSRSQSASTCCSCP